LFELPAKGAAMRPRGAFHSLVAILSLLVLPAARAWAQAPPSPITPPAGGAASSGGGAGTAAVVLLVLALLVIVGVGVKIYDLKRKREAEAVHLQAQISDALLREKLLFGLPITPTARVPIWKGSATIEVAGQVPSPQERDTALRIIRAEAARIRSDFQIEDRLAVVPRRVA
jgi:hypothetical protein